MSKHPSERGSTIATRLSQDGSFQKSVPPTAPRANPLAVKGESKVRSRPIKLHGEKEALLPDRTVHNKWAAAAWEAIEYAFIRYPDTRKLGQILSRAKAPFIHKYEERSLQGTAIKWLKFHCSYAFAVGVCQTELATVPYDEKDREADGCFCADLQHTMHHAMKRAAGGNWAYRRFLIDILYAKNGMPPAMEGFVKASLLDHMSAMQRKEPTDWLDRTLLKKPLQLVEAEIRKEVSRIFRNRQFRHTDEFPSGGSSFDSSFKDGGAFRDLLDEFVAPIRKDGQLVFAADGTCDDRVLVGCFQDYVDKLWLDRLEEKLCVTPVALLEPLKVRIITKGQAAEYYRVCELQQFMHKILKQHPVFQYIGRPIDDRSFSACFGSQESLLLDEFFVSGDYKAATDNLNPRLSELVWEQICSQVTMDWQGVETLLLYTPYYLLGKKALTGHLVHYLSKNLGLDAIVAQSWGQLMGSPMSFPVLCIVNSSATHVALGLTLTRESKIRVNGDDIAFIANPRTYELWKAITAACGLEFSLGKNYCSREFIIMNSELRRAPHVTDRDFFVIPGEVKGDPESLEDSYTGEDPLYQEVTIVHGKVWRFEGFFNQSIARNIVRKGVAAGRVKDVYWTDLQPLSEALLKGINKKAQQKCLDVLLETNKSAIAERPSGCNLYLPKCLGGAGVKIPATSTIEEMAIHTSPPTMKRMLTRAAYLATHGARRLELPSVGVESRGPAETAIKMARAMAPKRVPVPKADRKHDLGFNGTQLLSRVIQIYTERGYMGLNPPTANQWYNGFEPRGPQIDAIEKLCQMQADCGARLSIAEVDGIMAGGGGQNREGHSDPVLFGEPLATPQVHKRRLDRLNRSYHKFVNGCYTGIEPMGLAKAHSFEETEMLDCLWPVVDCECSTRSLDTLETYYSSFGFLDTLA